MEDCLAQYLKGFRGKLLTREGEVELAEKIEDKYWQLTHILCHYGREYSKLDGLVILEERLREVLGEENTHYEDFLRLKKKISRSRKDETLSRLYDQVFKLLYYSQKGGEPDDEDDKSIRKEEFRTDLFLMLPKKRPE